MNDVIDKHGTPAGHRATDPRAARRTRRVLGGTLGLWCLLAQAAWAAPGDPLADLTAFLCTIFETLSGGFGIALSLVVLGIGLLLLALGARGALSRIGVGVVAIAGLVTLPTLFVSLFPATAGTVCGI